MKIFTIATLLIITLLYNIAEARPAAVSQESNPGVMTNHVSGSGSSANSYSESKTTVTDKDGITTVSENSIISSSTTRYGKINRMSCYTVSLTSFFLSTISLL